MYIYQASDMCALLVDVVLVLVYQFGVRQYWGVRPQPVPSIDNIGNYIFDCINR